MTSRTVELTVGFFMLLGFVALAFLAIQVSGMSDLYRYERGYTLEVSFNNIGGLKKRAKVALAGVEIGRVTGIEIDRVTFTAKVSLHIYETYNNIPEDSEVYILTSGLLGDNYISITPGFEETPLSHKSQINIDKTHDAIILENLLSRLLVNETK